MIFEQAIKNKARVVLAASIAVYGDKIHSQSCPEETGYGKTFGPYSRTKQAQEKLAWDYYKNKDMKLTFWYGQERTGLHAASLLC